MLKVNFFDKKVRAIFYRYTTGITGAIAAIVLFWDIPVEYKNPAGNRLWYYFVCDLHYNMDRFK